MHITPWIFSPFLVCFSAFPLKVYINRLLSAKLLCARTWLDTLIVYLSLQGEWQAPILYITMITISALSYSNSFSDFLFITFAWFALIVCPPLKNEYEENEGVV